MNIKSLCLVGTLFVSVGICSDNEQSYPNHQSNHVVTDLPGLTEVPGINGHNPANGLNTNTQQNANVAEYASDLIAIPGMEEDEPALIEVPGSNNHDLANEHSANMSSLSAGNLNDFIQQYVMNSFTTHMQNLLSGNNVANANTGEQNGDVAHESAAIEVPVQNEQPNNNDPAHNPQANETENPAQNSNNNQQENYTIENLTNDFNNIKF